MRNGNHINCNLSNNENWLEDFIGYKDYEEREVKVGIKWCFQIFLIVVCFFMVYDAIENDEIFLYVLATFILSISFLSIKFTTLGYYGGFNFYLFSFYSKRLQSWEEFPIFTIFSYWFSYGISVPGLIPGIIIRWAHCNFDELAELISQNKRIKPNIRRDFIDYVNKRKQMSKMRKMLPTIILFTLIYLPFIFIIFF